MQKQKYSVLKILLLVLCAVLAAAIGFCIVPVTSYFKGRSEPLDATLLATEEKEASNPVLTISNDELTKLIEGKISLEELEEQPDLIIVKSDDPSAASVAAEAASSAGSSADRSSESSASSDEDAAASEKNSESTSTEHSSAKNNTTVPEAAYEAEVKVLIQQLYAVKGRAEGGLNACIASARSEYKSLPPEQQTQSRKVAICFSKAGQLSALQSSCDKEVNSIVSQMRKVLQENGQSTDLADQAMSTYKSMKSARYSSLMHQLYH